MAERLINELEGDKYQEDIKRVLKVILFIIPIPALIIFGVNFYLGNYFIAFMLLSIPVFCFISYQFINSDKIQAGVFFLVIIISAIATLSCMFGNGIHETAIVAFPVIILFSSFILNARGVVASTLIVILSLAVVVYAEKYGLYPHRPIPPGRVVDLITLSAILAACLIITHFLAQVNKNGLKRSLQELENQKLIQSQIEKNLEIKSKLLREVHHRVKNNLTLINSILDLEIMSSDLEKKDLQALQRRIQAIARVHDPLFQSMDYQEVDIKAYLEQLIMSFSSSFMIPDKQIQLSIASKAITIERAIPLGIILHEVMSAIQVNEKSTIFIKLKTEPNKQLYVQVETGEFVLQEDSLEKKLIDLMADELHTDNLVITDHSFSVEFTPNA